VGIENDLKMLDQETREEMEIKARQYRNWANQALADAKDSPDDVNKPRHYCGHPSGVECIEVVEHMNFCLGNAMKYIWRAPLHADLFH
jgi:hypothetical protein